MQEQKRIELDFQILGPLCMAINYRTEETSLVITEELKSVECHGAT